MSIANLMKQMIDSEDMEAMFKEAMEEKAKKDAEFHYLRWFKQNADFGPADSDVHSGMDADYLYQTGKEVPKDWRQE